MSSTRQYLAIDLKSFFASVECVERGLDPLDTNLVVADASRTTKTICLAVTPSLKSYGIPGRPRLFEVVKAVREINRQKSKSLGEPFWAMSVSDRELKANPRFGLDYIIAPPRMALYMDYSSRIYQIYLKYFAKEDIDIYSIDEVFIDATEYLNPYNLSAKELLIKIIQDILKNTGITATAGIGTNLYLAKIAMDIVAKHKKADINGVRLASLDELSYRKLLWDHKPLTDFWRVGKGYQNRLESVNLHTMGDIARCSLGKKGDYYSPELLYKLFGINAELLIDHAWGYESTTLADIHKLKPERKSLGEGQVLHYPYNYQKSKIIIREMAEKIALNLTAKGYFCKKIVLTVGYDVENYKDPKLKQLCSNQDMIVDSYGRFIPKNAHGTINLKYHTCSVKMITDASLELFDKIINPHLLTRRVNICACELSLEGEFDDEFKEPTQLDLFSSIDGTAEIRKLEKESLKREHKLQHAMLKIKGKYGNNAVLKGTDFEEGATTRERNEQIGGHIA